MSAFSYNGGTVIAMAGKNCVAIASDKRLGEQFFTISCEFAKIFEVGPTLYVGFPGLATDTVTLYEKLRFRVNLYELRENRKIQPPALTSLLSNMLYEKRFGPYFINPVVAGLTADAKPVLCVMDVLGCTTTCEDFVCTGTAEEQAYGLCETLWKPDMGPDELFETISQSLMNAFDRDAISGWGAVVYIIEKDKVTTKTLRARMD